jgi:Transglycosylase SLT domain
MWLGATQCSAPAGTGSESPTIAPIVASAAVEAVIVPGPDGTLIEGRCTQWEHLLIEHAPPKGWDALRMSKLAWRESNCWPAIRSKTSDTGLLQINDITLEFLNTELGEPVDRWTLTDPVQNVRAAAALCDFWARNGSSCYLPWAQT